MYERLINKRCKIVFLDGTKVAVVKGLIKEYSQELKTILLTDSEDKEIYISALQIQKLEVLEE